MTVPQLLFPPEQLPGPETVVAPAVEYATALAAVWPLLLSVQVSVAEVGEVVLFVVRHAPSARLGGVAFTVRLTEAMEAGPVGAGEA